MISNLFSNAIYMLLTILIFSLAFDLLIGEFPVKIHPVVIVGNMINYFKGQFIDIQSRTSGFLLAVCVIILSSFIFLIPLLVAEYLALSNEIWSYLFKVVALLLLSTTFSVKLLLSSAREVEDDLKIGKLNQARQKVSYLVSRDTDKLNKEHVISAVIETLTENIPDSYVSTIFYYVLFGVIAYFMGFNDYNSVIIAVLAAFIHRIIDTMDSMLGYQTEELYRIGYFPAKLDDAVNYIPARLSAIVIVVAAFALNLNYKNSFFVMRRDGSKGPSPNSAYTMSAVAGALGIELEKEGVYTLGTPLHNLKTQCISKAIDLTRLTIAFATIFYIFVLADVLLYLI